MKYSRKNKIVTIYFICQDFFTSILFFIYFKFSFKGFVLICVFNFYGCNWFTFQFNLLYFTIDSSSIYISNIIIYLFLCLFSLFFLHFKNSHQQNIAHFHGNQNWTLKNFWQTEIYFFFNYLFFFYFLFYTKRNKLQCEFLLTLTLTINFNLFFQHKKEPFNRFIFYLSLYSLKTHWNPTKY